jgi:dihydropteroate synthase
LSYILGWRAEEFDVSKGQARLETFLAALAARPLIMGILNLTPDSFSDGGRFQALEAAREQAKKLAEGGADILDVGAESTRPGHTPVSAEEEWRRLEPALAVLVDEMALPFSIDTYKAETARRALALGVSVVNDVWGLQRDPAMAETVAAAGAGLVVMHNRETVEREIDIVEDMLRFFERSLALAERAGVARAHILIDPGIGFGKSRAQNLRALKATERLKGAFGLPVLIGVSRKRMFGELLGAGVDDRLIGTLAANLAALARGASVFRVHDAAEHRAAFTVFEAIANA